MAEWHYSKTSSVYDSVYGSMYSSIYSSMNRKYRPGAEEYA